MPVTVYPDLCATITVMMLIASLIFRKQTTGRSNMLFMGLCFCVFISGLTDIISYYFDNVFSFGSIGIGYQAFIDYIYFLVRNFTPALYILYVCSQTGIWHKIALGNGLHIAWAIPYTIDIILLFSNPWTKWIFYFDNNGIYQRGPLMPLLYLIAFYYMFLGLGILLRYIKQIDRTKFYILILFLPINAIAVIIQFIVPALRIEVMASVLLLLVVVISVQKPEEMMDRIVGTMSNNAFLLEMRQSFNTGRPMAVLFINFTNHGMLRNNLGLFSYNVLLKRLADKTSQISKIMELYPDIYYLDNGSFAVITDMNKADNLLDLGRMVHAYMQEPVKLSHMETMVNTLVCLVKCPEDINDFNVFITFSRSFQNKLVNNNRVIVLSDISSSRDFIMRNQMDTIINKAITNHRFQMYYQPIYSLKKHRFVSAEALIRLYDDDYGFVPPSLFIPAAEESGAIHKIGDFVIEDVCRFISSQNFEDLGLEYIEINLSVSQCIEKNLAEKIKGYMDKYNVSPSQINLEITETAADYDPITTDKNISELSDMGLSFSLDDYGTGYSNIKRVVNLPLDIVKLDKCLVDEMDSNQMWIVITRTVKMLQRMNKKILVEGVETENALRRFESIGCDYIQGYYFSKPLSEGEFIFFVTQNNKGLL